MKKLLLILMFLVFISFVNAEGELLYEIDSTTTIAYLAYDLVTYQFECTNFTISSNEDIIRIDWYLSSITSSDGNWKIGIWSDSAGEPDSPLQNGSIFPTTDLVASSWNPINLTTAISLSINTIYWACIEGDFAQEDKVVWYANDIADQDIAISGDGVTWGMYNRGQGSIRVFNASTASPANSASFEEPTPADNAEIDYYPTINVSIIGGGTADLWWNYSLIQNDGSTPITLLLNSTLLPNQGTYTTDISIDEGVTNTTRTIYYVDGYVDCGSVWYTSEVMWGGNQCNGTNYIFDDINDNSPTFNFTTFRDTDCKLWDLPLNYTDLDTLGVPDCGTTGGKNHTCTLNKYLDMATEEHTLYGSCKGDLEVNTFTGTSAVINLKLNISTSGTGQAGYPVSWSKLNPMNFTSENIGFNYSIFTYNPNTEDAITITHNPPSVDWGTGTSVEVAPNSTNSTSFYNTLSRTAFDQSLVGINGSVTGTYPFTLPKDYYFLAGDIAQSTVTVDDMLVGANCKATIVDKTVYINAT